MYASHDGNLPKALHHNVVSTVEDLHLFPKLCFHRN